MGAQGENSERRLLSNKAKRARRRRNFALSQVTRDCVLEERTLLTVTASLDTHGLLSIALTASNDAAIKPPVDDSATAMVSRRAIRRCATFSASGNSVFIGRHARFHRVHRTGQHPRAPLWRTQCLSAPCRGRRPFEGCGTMTGEDRNRVRKARVTVKDLARDLSLSTSTISRAFYTDAVIAPSTRTAVLTRAAEIGCDLAAPITPL